MSKQTKLFKKIEKEAMIPNENPLDNFELEEQIDFEEPEWDSGMEVHDYEGLDDEWEFNNFGSNWNESMHEGPSLFQLWATDRDVWESLISTIKASIRELSKKGVDLELSFHYSKSQRTYYPFQTKSNLEDINKFHLICLLQDLWTLETSQDLLQGTHDGIKMKPRKNAIDMIFKVMVFYLQTLTE